MKWGHAVRVRKGTILYAAGVLACGNVLLQVLGFVYRVVLSRFAGAEGLGVYRRKFALNGSIFPLHTRNLVTYFHLAIFPFTSVIDHTI